MFIKILKAFDCCACNKRKLNIIFFLKKNNYLKMIKINVMILENNDDEMSKFEYIHYNN